MTDARRAILQAGPEPQYLQVITRKAVIPGQANTLP